MSKFTLLGIPRSIYRISTLRDYHTTVIDLGKSRKDGSASTEDIIMSALNLKVFKPKFNVDEHGLPRLTEKDCLRRVTFASRMLAELENDSSLIHSIFFSDEGNFRTTKSLAKTPNILVPGKGKRKASTKKIHESAPLPQIVWCAMNTKEVIGPYFFNSHVTDRTYLKMLRTYFLPQLEKRGYNLKSTWFQQDGAPWHRSKRLLSFLKETFDGRLISYGCPIFWPSKSQDLTPLDYFLWDYLKAKIQSDSNPPETVMDLRIRIVHEIENINPQLVQSIVLKFKYLLEKCIDANGKRFDGSFNKTP